MRRLSLALILLAASVAANAATPAHKCKYSRIAEMPVQIQNGQPVTEGWVNGQKVGVLLDTGAAPSFIYRSAVPRLGLIPFEMEGYRVFGIGGELSAHAVHVEEFRLGEAVRKGWRVLLTGERSPGSNVAVALGYDFFQTVDVEFDLQNGLVRLFRAVDCDNISLAYWTTEPAGQASIESHSKLEVTVQINGLATRAQLDSGAGTSIVELDFAARLGVTPQSPGVVSAGCSFGLGRRPVEEWIGQFESFAIGNERIANPRLRFGDVWKDMAYAETGSRLPKRLEGMPSMLLGADFLRSHRVLIAHSQRKIYFTYVGGTVFPAAIRATACEPRS